MTTARVTAFATALRTQRKVQPATVAWHLRTLRAIVRWAHGEGLIAKLPKFTMPGGFCCVAFGQVGYVSASCAISIGAVT